MTPDESVAEAAKLADAAKAVIGKWTRFDGNLTPEENKDPGFLSCKLPDGQKGTNYGLAWAGPGVPDPEKAITEIQAAWRKLGTEAVITKPGEKPGTGDSYYLSYPGYLVGTDSDGYYLELNIDTENSTIITRTHCIPVPSYINDLPPLEIPTPSDGPNVHKFDSSAAPSSENSDGDNLSTQDLKDLGF